MENQRIENQHTPKENILDVDIQKEMATQLAKIEKNKQALVQKAPSTWKLSQKGKDAVSRGVSLFQTDFGLYAAIPLLCKGEDCPYATLFPDLHDSAVEDGERCPVEVAFIMTKYDKYMKELDITEDDAVDMSILRDLIDYDIQILRADNKMSVEGDFLKDTIVTVDESGKPIYKEDISATARYKEGIQNRRNRSMELLHSTRKDKAGTKITNIMDPSSYATELLKRAQKKEETVDAVFEELEIIDDVPFMKNMNK